MTRRSLEKVIAPSKRVLRTLMTDDKRQRLRLVPPMNACRNAVEVRAITSWIVRATHACISDDAAASRPSSISSSGKVTP
jgi:hypothetical protein